MLTPDFGKIQIAMKMVSSEWYFSIKIFTSPSGTTLMFRLYSFDFILRTETILRVAYFNVSSGFFANHVFKMASDEGALLRNCLRLVDAIDFDI